MHPLNEWVKSKGLSMRRFAFLIGIHHSQLSRYTTGKSIPHWTTARKIAFVTKNEIPVSTWHKKAEEEFSGVEPI
jgi:transcriptional regulator with XRE-family HTH domain